jgi:hypothetical protein
MNFRMHYMNEKELTAPRNFAYTTKYRAA